jgi:hypothetical protein
MSLSTQNPAVLAVIAVAGLYLLSQNKASAQGRTAATRSPLNQGSSPYFSSPPRFAQPAAQQSNPLSALLNLGTALIGRGGINPSNAGVGMAAPGVPYDYAITNTAQPGQEGYGWQYFSDGTSGGGTAISQDGVYYNDGVPVYYPAMSATETVSGYPTDYQNY